MRVDEDLWVRAGQIIEQIQSITGMARKDDPRVKLCSNMVVITFTDYDFAYPQLQDLHSEVDSLQEQDKYDVNTKEGFRVLVRGDEK